MFDRLTKLASSSPGYPHQLFPHVTAMEDENRLCENFFKGIENWRNLELNYIAKLN